MSERFKKAVLAILFSIVLTAYFWGPMLQAKWFVADDHEIAYFLGKNDHLPIKDFVPTLLSTEVGSPGKILRYRPAYYIVRIVETMVFGGSSPNGWYVFRMLIFAGSASFLSFFLLQYFGFAFGLIFSLFLLSQPYWADIFARLGAGETYCVLGLVLFLLGFYQAWRFKEEETFVKPAILIALGTFLAAGSKENFVILGAPLLVLLVKLYREKRLKPVMLIAILLSGLYMIGIIAAVLIALKRFGHDVYGTSVAVNDRFAVLRGLRTLPNKIWLLGILGSLSVLWLSKRLTLAESHQKWIQFQIPFLKVMGICFMIYFANFFFYNGDPPDYLRYAYPGFFFRSLAMVFIFWNGYQFLNACLKSSKARVYFSWGMSLLVLVFVLNNRVGLNREYALSNRRITFEYTDYLNRINERLKRYPDLPLVFVSQGVDNYEKTYAVQRFLYHFGRTNPMYLLFRRKDFTSWGVLEQNFQNTMINGREYFRPLSELDFKKGCVSISLEDLPDSRCISLGN